MPAKLLKQGIDDVVRVSDARMSGTSFGTVVLHVAPESAIGGPLAIVQNGDEIVLDTAARRIDLASPETRSSGAWRQFRPAAAALRSRLRQDVPGAYRAGATWAAISISSENGPSVSRKLFFVALAIFLFIAQRGAYQGYFQNDDLDNLAFTRELPVGDFLVPFVYPRVYPNNFRPTGHLVYRLLGQTAGLRYTPYIFLIQLVHFANCILLWLILKRLDLPDVAAGCGVLFFAFNMAVFDVFWMPMYVFDLLCGCFCLLSLLAYLNGRWVLALLAMWVAYRAKEVAIMLPVLFLWHSGRRRALPVMALSLILGVQALVQNHARPDSDYTLHLDLARVWKCVEFYAGRVFLVPYAGLLILLLPVLLRDRRVLLGVAGFGALLAPMLLLPGRLSSAYLYVPLFSLAIAAAVVAARSSSVALAILLAAWLPWNYVNLRLQRNTVLADAPARRAFSEQLFAFNRAHPEILAYVYGGAPVNPYGTHAIVKLAHAVGAPLRFVTLEDPQLPEVLSARSVALVSWDHTRLRTVLKTPQSRDASYLKMSEETPLWQLGAGWYPLEGAFRWTQPEASVRLERPAGASRFELAVNIGPQYIRAVRHSHVTVLLNGAIIGESEFTTPGWQTVRWPLPPAAPGPAHITIRVTPEFYANRKLGIAVGGLGFGSGPAH